jgi:hypothetical protein
MNYLILALGVITSALWFPLNVSFTASVINKNAGTSFKPNPLMYLVLGALIGAMVAIGMVQGNPEQHGLHGLLIVPGILVGLPLAMVLLCSSGLAFLCAASSLCSSVARFCRNLRLAWSMRTKT